VGKMKSNILFGVIFFLLFTSSAYACKNPVLYTEQGSAINVFGGYFTINGTTYPDLVAQYNLGVRNENDQGLIVTLKPSNDIKDYISGGSIFVEARSRKNITLDVWVGGLSKSGTIYIYFVCEDGSGQYIFPYAYVYIIGKGISPPPTSTCDSSGLDGCYEGMYRTYYCANGTLQYTDICTNYCCKGYDKEAFCSVDKRMCISPNNIPPGTEGNIAFLCKNSKCDSKIEKQVILLLRLSGWNVTKRAYYDWNETELDKHDIIVCTDESKACSIRFNSVVYNQHVEKRQPLLEIADSSMAKAAYYLGYLDKRFKGTTKKDLVNITSTDQITTGYSGSVYVTTETPMFVAISPSYFTNEIIDLADAGASGHSVFFKVNATSYHGKYAFIGWLYNYKSGALTATGETLLERTLHWLKDNNPSGSGSSGIAFICGDERCDRGTEKDLITLLRKNDFKVTAKALDDWTEESLKDYDVMVCSYSSRGCRIEVGSPVYNAHMNFGKGFVEISDNSRINAGYTFGYVSSSSASKKSQAFITPVINDEIFSGFSGDINVSTVRRSLSGIQTYRQNSVQDLAHLGLWNLSTMFRSDALGNKGRYSFIGWIPYPEYLSTEGKELLLRTVRWTWCGNPFTC
jgi:hypothetical protein